MSRRALRSVHSTLVWIIAWSATLTVALLGVLFRKGYLLTRDAVTTPRSYITSSTLNLGDGTGSSVGGIAPQEAFIALVSHVIDGGLVVKILLFATLMMAGVGAACLGWFMLYPGTTGQALAQGLPAATFAIWNPYVVERLLLGHWSLLIAYACLPWIGVLGMLTFSPGRVTRLTAWSGLLATMAAAAFTPTGAVMGAFMALASILVSRRNVDARELRQAHDHTISSLTAWQRVLLILGCELLVSLPWLYPTILSYSQRRPTPDLEEVAALVAQSEGPQGALSLPFTLLGMGGIWNHEGLLWSRSSLYVFPATLVLVSILAVGFWRYRRTSIRKVLYIWAALDLAMIFLISFLSYTVGLQVLTWLAQHIPGIGLFRDTHKWIALLFPLYTVLISGAGRATMEWCTRHRTGLINPATAISGLCVLLLLIIPDAPLATWTHLRPVRYSTSWQEIVNITKKSNGDMVVLPPGELRIYSDSMPWPVRDPAPFLMPIEVITLHDLPASALASTRSAPGSTVLLPGSDFTREQQVGQAIFTSQPAGVLASLGVRWVLVENTVSSTTMDTLGLRNTLRGLEPVITAPHLTLYKVPGIVNRDYAPTRWQWALAFAMHLVWLLTLVGAYALTAYWGLRERKRSQQAAARYLS